jgi:hypothetical protein
LAASSTASSTSAGDPLLPQQSIHCCVYEAADSGSTGSSSSIGDTLLPQQWMAQLPTAAPAASDNAASFNTFFGDAYNNADACWQHVIISINSFWVQRTAAAAAAAAHGSRGGELLQQILNGSGRSRCF